MARSKTPPTTSLVETDKFDFEFLSEIAQRESWRKELHRPIYHLHKWWANRLGSVFRGIVLGAFLPPHATLRSQFYRKHSFAGKRVLDPFMGSGTTVGETYKLGCIALGQDINPVACESVRVALGKINAQRLDTEFRRLEQTVGQRIKPLYTAEDRNGEPCDVLYYFWVKVVPCPHCNSKTDLFPTRIIARNADPARKPEVHVCCPGCGDIFQIPSAREPARCRSCGVSFLPDSGAVSGLHATCQHCRRPFAVAKTVRATGQPPDHRLYAKLILTPAGRKEYLPASQSDLTHYHQSTLALASELKAGTIRLPESSLDSGHNTKQAIGYNYKSWRQFFNDRQLLSLAWLQKAISEIEDSAARDVLLILFSGLLEFNNMFASYKGEGTGAVRHMFSHHILKPERTPIEANVWGTPRSSGSFLNLYNSRLKRAIAYRDNPFELNATTGEKVYGINREFAGRVVVGFPQTGSFADDTIYLACGSSDSIALPDCSVDAVVTDPPFFDNVHYSELADFFYAWQKLCPGPFVNGVSTTRHAAEVQDADAQAFAAKLCAVFRESDRVLRDGGLLVFTYHHSRPDAWQSVFQAITQAGLSVLNCHPVKAELSVAAPKSQAKEPIQLDAIIVCRKTSDDPRPTCTPITAIAAAKQRAAEKINRLRAIGLNASRNDVRVVFMGQLMAELCPQPASADTAALLSSLAAEIEHAIEQVATLTQQAPGQRAADGIRSLEQLQLPFAP